MAQPPTTYYAVLLERVDNWHTRIPIRQQEQWDEHAAFMDALVDEGFVILGGPLGDGKNVLLIIATTSEQDIERRLADDPWTSLGLLRIVSIEHWEVLLKAHQQ
ncbi:MAG TPA: hypothetical protein VKY19_22225 [Ktedonosporobacter sp.]|nr:hypothetical protein [Ktedonosporobacter sp.]